MNYSLIMVACCHLGYETAITTTTTTTTTTKLIYQIHKLKNWQCWSSFMGLRYIKTIRQLEKRSHVVLHKLRLPAGTVFQSFIANLKLLAEIRISLMLLICAISMKLD
jgi:hypothetical protein